MCLIDDQCLVVFQQGLPPVLPVGCVCQQVIVIADLNGNRCTVGIFQILSIPAIGVQDPLTHTVYSAGEEVHLPEMEYQLLYYFLQHPGQTLSRKTLMLAVWGAPPGLKTRTLDIHICQLRKKLKLGSSLQTVFKVGYKLRLPTNRNEGERCNP